MTLYLRHDSGATHALSGKRLTKLLRELKAGRGQPEMTQLVVAGYSETLHGTCIDSLDYETVAREAGGNFER